MLGFLLKGDGFSWVSHISVYLQAEALGALCSGLFFQGCLHIEQLR